MRFLENIVSTFFKSEEDQNRLHKVVIPSFIIHFFAAVLGIVLPFIMSRGLGSSQYGVFSFSFSIVTVIVNLATYGICLTVVRDTPSLLSKGKTELWKGLYKWSAKLVLRLGTLVSLLIAAFIAFATFYLHILKETQYTIPLLLAIISIPLCGIMNYYSALLRGQHKVVLSLLPDNIVKPSFYLLFLAALFAFSIEFNAKSAVLLNAIAYLVATFFAMATFYNTTKLKGISEEYDSDTWKKSVKSFFLLILISSINSKMDIFMLTYLKDSAQVGIYNIADMIASKLMLFLQIMNLITAASISRMHTLEQKQKLQVMISKVSRWVMVITLPVFFVIVIFRRVIMSYFGADFESGQTALLIISVGQIVNIVFGPVGNYAIMTGNQRYSSIFYAINIVINVALNLILTPTMGINGTAIATACALITWNVGMFFTIWRKTGIRTWIFG